MKDDIPQFLQDKLKQSKALTNKFPDTIKQFLIDYSEFYNWGLGDNLSLIFKVLKQIKSELPGCGYNECNNKVIITKEGIVSNGCCYQHAVKATNIEKYGVENNLQIPSVREKIEKNNMVKYGVKNVGQAETIKQKMRETNQRLHGVDNAMKNKDISSTQQKKMKETMIKKYGVEYALHNPELLDKHHNSLYKHKKFQWKSGEIVNLQGNEPIVLRELEENGYTFETVFTDVKDMPEIWYSYEGKQHRYYPDFYIPSENLIIEVKSQYILDLQWDKNQAKFQATKDLGFEFRLEVR